MMVEFDAIYLNVLQSVKDYNKRGNEYEKCRVLKDGGEFERKDV